MPRRPRAFQKAALILAGCIIMASAVYALTIQYWPPQPSPSAIVGVVSSPVRPRGAISTIVTPPLVIDGSDQEAEPRQLQPAATKTDGEVSQVIVTPPIEVAAASTGSRASRELPPSPRRVAQDTPSLTSRVMVAQEPPSLTSGVMARFKAPVQPSPEIARRDLPVVPERDDVYRVMGSIRNDVQQCYDTGMVPGEITLTLTVLGQTGRVQHASVSETSSTATCIRRLMKKLRFPHFAKKKITIEYPYFFK